MLSDNEYADLLERLRHDLAPKPEFADQIPDIRSVAEFTQVYIENGDHFTTYIAVAGKWYQLGSENSTGNIIDIISGESMIQDFYLEVSKGNIPGTSYINKFGENDGILGNVEEFIWDGSTATYPYPSTADMTHISTVADIVAMRGEKVELQGLDENWSLIVQDAYLDVSDSSVLSALPTAMKRIFRMKFQSAIVGTSDLEATNSAGTVLYAMITAGYNQTRMAMGTVPAGKTAYMTKYYASVTIVTNKIPTGYLVKLWGQDNANGYAPQIKHSIGGIGEAIEHDFKPYLKFTEKTDVYMTGIPADNPGQISAGFDIILVNN